MKEKLTVTNLNVNTTFIITTSICFKTLWIRIKLILEISCDTQLESQCLKISFNQYNPIYSVILPHPQIVLTVEEHFGMKECILKTEGPLTSSFQSFKFE